MAQMTISANASATLDGMVSTAACTGVSSIQDFAQFTRDVSATPVEVYTGSWAFLAVVNTGAVEMIVQVLAGANYPIFCVPAGAHLLLPSSFTDIAGDVFLGSSVTLYTASSTSRAIVLVGINNV